MHSEGAPHIRNAQITRRGFLGGAAALGAMAYEGYTNAQTHQPEDEVEVSEGIEEVESIEEIAEDLLSPVYDQVLAARTIESGGLRRDQVVFVDSLGRQLTEVFDLTESVGLTPRDMTWSFQGDKPAGIPGTWIKEQENYISEQTGIPPAEINMLSVYLDLDNADQENFTSRVEMAYNNATRVVAEDVFGRDALTIIREETHFENIPDAVAQYLKPHIVGIACEESRFDANKTSLEEAVGFMQTMPDVFEKYKIEHNLPDLDPRNLVEQLPVGLQHIEVSYLELVDKLDIELAYITQLYFNGNSASMEKYFLTPCIIGSYNFGQARMIKVVQWFLQNYPEPESAVTALDQTESLSGYDVFFAMTHQCALQNGVDKFGDESSTYVSKVMGWTQAFSNYEDRLKGLQLASN